MAQCCCIRCRIKTSDDAIPEGVWVQRRRRAEEYAALEIRKRSSGILKEQSSTNDAPFGKPHDAVKWAEALYRVYEPFE
ncbi:uncharacterized protein CTRU02_203151 [Colletotrichum truncatum]|uniref:Uncharacterized protein n=1 Tax=Colletotrichum truncatum TaxID=5467 RepID=A0ACC3Z8G8_COLTU